MNLKRERTTALVSAWLPELRLSSRQKRERVKQATPKFFDRIDNMFDQAVDKIAAGNLRDGFFDLLTIKNILTSIRQSLPNTDSADERIEMIERIEQSVRPMTPFRAFLGFFPVMGLGIDPEEIEEKFKQAMRSGEGIPIELTAQMMHRHDISKLEKPTPYALDTARFLFEASKPLVKKIMTGRATPEDLRVLTNMSEDIIDLAKEVLKREPTLAQRSEAQIMQSVAETTKVLIDDFQDNLDAAASPWPSQG